MNVLLACGSSALQRSILHAFTAAGHDVRVLRRPGAVTEEPVATHVHTIVADSPSTVYDAAHGCDAAVLIEPSVASSAADASQELDLIERALEAAAASALRRVIRVTGGEVQRPDSARRLRDGSTEIVTVASGPVYGITHDPITLFLIMMRSLPAVPILSEKHAIRPVWHGDLARALVTILDLPSSEVPPDVRIAGPDRVTQSDLYERIAAIIDRRPLRIPVPDFLAAHGTALAEALKLPVPFEESHLSFAAAAEGDEPGHHELASPFGVRATHLDEGLRRVVSELEELPPSEGVGTLEVKLFSIDVERPHCSPAALIDMFRRRFRDVMPVVVGVEPAAPAGSLSEGAVVTMPLPGRGHVQVRVEEVADDHVVVATLRGHVVAGVVRFGARAIPGGVRFEVMTCDRAANALDWLALTLGGARIQDANWTRVAQNVAALAGGTAGPVSSDARRLREDEARGAQRWIADIIERHRARHSPPTTSSQSAAS